MKPLSRHHQRHPHLKTSSPEIPPSRLRKKHTTFTLIATLAALILGGCQKIPLTPDYGFFDSGIAHWFENEGVVYLFFSIAEKHYRITSPQYFLKVSFREPDGGESPLEELQIDFSQGVHEHGVVACGPARVCGSYSLRSTKPLVQVSLEFRYDSAGKLGIQQNFAIQNHPQGEEAAPFSALAYGVFDETNEHIQVRMVDHFGTPSTAEITQYAMKRKFRISDVRLKDITLDQLTQHRQTVGSPLGFPAAPAATVCADGPRGDPSAWVVEQGQGWYQGTLERRNPASAACFEVQFIDKAGAPLLKQTRSGIALRNPVLKEQKGLQLKNPLVETLNIPIVLKICDDDPSRGQMVDADFFTYQRYVLGFANAPEDLCFRIGRGEDFRLALYQRMNQKLVEAQASNLEGRDYLFTVVLHEKFSPEFREIQSVVAETITLFAKNDASKFSPRVVGGFVYSGSTDFFPSIEQQPYVLWCPQMLLDQAITPPLASLGQENCMIAPILEADLRIINFVAPLGPLPSLEKYKEYRSRFGDAGLAKNPRLKIMSVPQNTLTQVEEENRVTYFDAQRYVIGSGEKARFCTNRASRNLLSVRIKLKDSPPDALGVPLGNINGLWLSSEAPGEYRLGISWRFSFWGGITYQGAINGKVISIIPYTRSQKGYEELGDSKWSQEVMNLGEAIQHCFVYCNHPFFTDQGEYQILSQWDSPKDISCQSPKIPAWNQETSP